MTATTAVCTSAPAACLMVPGGGATCGGGGGAAAVAVTIKRSVHALRHHASDARNKPPYTYPAMIYFAMHGLRQSGGPSPGHTLEDVCRKMVQQWAYFRTHRARVEWKCAVRYHLMVNSAFAYRPPAVAESEPGTTGLWAPDAANVKGISVMQARGATPGTRPKLNISASKTVRPPASAWTHRPAGKLQAGHSGKRAAAAAAVLRAALPGRARAPACGGGGNFDRATATTQLTSLYALQRRHSQLPLRPGGENTAPRTHHHRHHTPPASGHTLLAHKRKVLQIRQREKSRLCANIPLSSIKESPEEHTTCGAP